MRRQPVFLVATVGCLLVVPGCGATPAPACMSTSDDRGIATRAGSFELELYPSSVACDGAGVAAGAPLPVDTLRFGPGSRPQMALPAKGATLVLLAFADADGLQFVGSACAARVTPSDDRCVTLTLAAVIASVDGGLDGDVDPGAADFAVGTDGGLGADAASPPDLAYPVDTTAFPDLGCDAAGCPCAQSSDCPALAPQCAPGGRCVACLPSSDTCAAGTWCAPDDTCEPGCKSDGDCPTGKPRCDLARHACVACLVDGDCASATWCSSGACVAGCDLAGGRDCAGGLTCCGHVCLDTSSSTLGCGGCGIACAGGQLCCAGLCASVATDVANCGGCGIACSTDGGVPSCKGGACTWSCSAGLLHCTTANDGCETPASTTNCGACGVGCDTKTATGVTCTGATCAYAACLPGRADCNSAAPDADGCECATPGCCGTSCQTKHSDGLGDAFYDCQPLATYDANEATAACAAATGDAGLCQQYACNGATKAICSVGTGVCSCWGYTGSGMGHVALGSSGQGCECPKGGSPVWQ